MAVPAYAQAVSRSPYPHSDRELLTRIGRAAGGKAGYKQLVRELGLGGGRERRLLLEQLTRMVARGDLQRLEDELWAVPKRSAESAGHSNTRSTQAATGRSRATQSLEQQNGPARGGRERLQGGRLDLHRDGFGFVRPQAITAPGAKEGPKAQASPGRPGEQDIFIPPNALHGAMHGDLVLVDEDPPARDGRRSGRIARVLTRRNPTIVGIFHYARPMGGRRSFAFTDHAGDAQSNLVQPLDERLGGPILIAQGAEIPTQGLVLHRTLGAKVQPTADTAPRQPVTRQSGSALDAVAAASAKPDRAENDSQPLDPRPLEGMAVEVEVTSFAQPGRPAQGRVIEVLGPPDAFGVDVEIVIRKHAIPHTFPAHVLAEAEERAEETAAALPPDELAYREDFRGLAIVTIDGETARDFDDAVLVRSLPSGHTELQVHIADVGWYVRDGSALDTEARVRGTSVYFPDRAVPMLPHALSSGICSLLPHQDRLVLSCIMKIDTEGEIVDYRVAEGIIRSARRMTYTSVQQCLNASPEAAEWNEAATGRSPRHDAEMLHQSDDGSHIRKNDKKTKDTEDVELSPSEHGLQDSVGSDQRKSKGKTPVTPQATTEDELERERIGLEQPELPEAFDRMLELALRLNRKRVRRGSIDFDLPEPVVEFDADSNMKAIVRSERGWAHRLIEEFMLSANECVATWLTAQGIPSLYRIHEMPDPKRIVEFEETAAGFGQTLGIGTLPVRRVTMKSDRREAQRQASKRRDARAPQSHEIPASIPVTPQMYQRLVRRIQGKPEERILAYLMLRSLKQARYAEKNEGHFALASPCYTHFTSPIRRYPDLIVHRLLRTMLRRGANPKGGALHSGDPQPWAVALAQAQGSHAAAALGRTAEATRSPSPTAELRQRGGSEPVAFVGKRQKANRAGRIGWSGGETPVFVDENSAAENSADRSSDAPLPAEKTETSALQQQHALNEPDALQELNVRSAEPISAEELSDIAVESSQAERRAADAERELIEWKKIKFMADKVGDDFRGIILSVTKFGFFVELDDIFIEGLVPLGSLVGDLYSFRDADRSICGMHTGHCFRAGDRVAVLLDRIDRQQRRLQFALLPGTEPAAVAGVRSSRGGKSEAKKLRATEKRKAKPAGKAKARKRKRG